MFVSGIAVVAVAVAIAAWLIARTDEPDRMDTQPTASTSAVTKGFQPPFDPGQSPVMVGNDRELFLLRLEDPRQAAVYSPARDEWRVLPVPPYIHSRSWTMTETGPVGLGARCEPACDPERDDDRGVVLAARFDADAGVWTTTEIARTDRIELYTESLPLGAIGATAVFEVDDFVLIDSHNTAREIQAPPGNVERTCVRGSELLAVVAPEVGELDPEELEFPEFGWVSAYRRSVADPDAGWRRSPPESVSGVESRTDRIYGSGCSSDGVVLVSSTGYVIHDGTRSHAVKSTEALDTIVAPVAEHGAVGFTRDAVILVTVSGVEELRNTKTNALPPTRHLATVADLIVYYQRDNTTGKYSWMLTDMAR
jgi:hypothetical protein